MTDRRTACISQGAQTVAKQVLAELGLGVPGLSLETGLAKREYPLMFRRPTV